MRARGGRADRALILNHVAPPLRIAANDDAPQPTGRAAGLRRWFDRTERRLLMPVALVCLGLGLAFMLAGMVTDSVVISHASKSAMVFGFVGLRRAAGFGPETPVDASP